jgi:POT family proton-dependent oligopeptide transporter
VWLRESERKEERLQPTGNAPSPLTELKAALPFLAVFILYMSVYAQSSGALLLFARDHVQRSILGHTIVVETIAAFPSVFVLLATPLLAAIVQRLRKEDREPATGMKIIAGLLVTMVAFAVLGIVARHTSPDHKVAFNWLGLTMALISTGELLVVPMMQSLLGQLAPRSAFTTAFLFVSMSVGYTLGGWLGTLYERLPVAMFWGVCVGLVGVAAVGMIRFRNSVKDR